MRLLLDILQGMGLATAAGIRPFLPALVAGALAADDLGLDFNGTPYDFLEAPLFLAAMVVALIAVVILERRHRGADFEQGRVGAAVAGLGIGIGALLFAGSLADHGYLSWPGLLGGLACAALASLVVRQVVVRARTRLDAEARSALPVYVDGSAGLLAGLSVLIPPVSLLALGFLARLGLAGRRRAGEKYAGLRVLR